MYYNSISPPHFNSATENSSGKEGEKSSLPSSEAPAEKERHCYRIVLSFNGTNYFGWQRQKCGNTVQETMEEILRNVFREKDLVLTGCGRTDTGVHALGMTASFHTVTRIPEEELKNCLDKRVPRDILVKEVREMASFNAHAEAKWKSYVYTVKLHNYSLFLPDGCWCWLEEGDLEAVKSALKSVEGTHDFRAFSGRPAPDSRRTVYRVEFYDFSPMICFYFAGNGYLHKMVRRLVGGLHEVYVGKITAQDFADALQDPACAKVREVAPAKGLYLKKVFYSPEEWKLDTLEHPPFFY